jgi:hypothetical protein
MNDEAVYKTAPATPGLLIIGTFPQLSIRHHNGGRQQRTKRSSNRSLLLNFVSQDDFITLLSYNILTIVEKSRIIRNIQKGRK